MILQTLGQIDTTDVDMSITEVVEKIRNTPKDVIIDGIVDWSSEFVLKVLAALLISFFGVILIRKIKSILGNIFIRKKTDTAISSFVQSLVSISLTILLIIIVVSTLGIDTSSFAALLTGGGLAIGMALNGTLQNFAGGVMLLVFKPFKAGDFIEAKGYSGTVAEVTITSTKLTTTDNRVIIIPNGLLSNDIINNFSSRKKRRVDINVNVEYGASAPQTKELLLDIIKRDERILTKVNGAPDDPFVALSSLNDSSVEFVLRVWVKNQDYWAVKFDLNEKIYKELPENGIQFPFPQLDVNIKNN